MDAENEIEFPDTASSKRLGLVHGQKYCVIETFLDADGNAHATGEEWVFVGSKFSRFENEYILTVRVRSGGAESFGLICDVDKQGDVVQHIREYVRRI